MKKKLLVSLFFALVVTAMMSMSVFACEAPDCSKTQTAPRVIFEFGNGVEPHIFWAENNKFETAEYFWQESGDVLVIVTKMSDGSFEVSVANASTFTCCDETIVLESIYQLLAQGYTAEEIQNTIYQTYSLELETAVLAEFKAVYEAMNILGLSNADAFIAIYEIVSPLINWPILPNGCTNIFGHSWRYHTIRYFHECHFDWLGNPTGCWIDSDVERECIRTHCVVWQGPFHRQIFTRPCS